MEYFDNVIWNYKNFNMANELDIAGEFIYDGIQKLNETSCIEESSSLFSFLYHISVGIERLQKIILVLCEKITIDSYEKFEKELKTHSHSELSQRITKYTNNKFNSQENEFLQVLTGFYKSARYNRFNVFPSGYKEGKLLSEYVKKYIEHDKIQYHFITGKIVVDENIKEFIGRVVGGIAKKYYNLLKEKARENNTYSYELRAYSKAERVFLTKNRKNSLQELKITEKIVFKEFLIYLRNTRESCSLLRYIVKIKPLDIDVGLISEYISELSSGVVSYRLIDEVEFRYGEEGYSIDRMNEIDAIGDPYVSFDIGDIFDCIQQMEECVHQKIDINTFSVEFPEFVEKLDNPEITGEFYEVLDLCKNLVEGQLNENKFMEQLNDILSEFNETYFNA